MARHRLAPASALFVDPARGDDLHAAARVVGLVNRVDDRDDRLVLSRLVFTLRTEPQLNTWTTVEQAVLEWLEQLSTDDVQTVDCSDCSGDHGSDQRLADGIPVQSPVLATTVALEPV